MAANSSNYETSLVDVKKDVRAITRDVKTLGTDAVALTSGAAEAAVKTVREGADTAITKAKEMQDHAAEWVRERPTVSILIALGVGALVARILSRK